MNIVMSLRFGMAGVLLAGCTGVTAPTARSSPPSVSTAPTVSGPKRIPAGGPIAPGRYHVARGPWTAVPYFLTMPAGWTAENSGQSISKHPNESDRELGFSVSIVDRLFADPCGPNDTVPISQSSESLVMGLRDLPGVEVDTPQPIAIGGRSGLKIGLTVEPGVDVDACDPPIGLQIWLDRSGNKYFVLGRESESWIYALDAPREGQVEGADNELFVLVGGHRLTSAPEDVAELIAVIESIEFQPGP
jgi:hypothetical protein